MSATSDFIRLMAEASNNQNLNALESAEFEAKVNAVIKGIMDINVGSPFEEEGTGLPAVDTTKAITREGRIGIGEPNPEELLDIVGNQTNALGGVKLDYTYDSGYIARVAYGGQKILNEVGVPVNTIQGHDMEVLGAGDWSQTRAFQIMGDLTGVTPVYAGLAYTCGVANLGGSTFGAGMNVYNIGVTPADRNFVATMRVNKGGGYQGNISSRMIGSDVGENLQPTTGMSITANSKTKSILLTPDYFRINAPLKLENYGAGTYIPGTILTDSLAHTGTEPTTLGVVAKSINVDVDGNILELNGAWTGDTAPVSAADDGEEGETRIVGNFVYKYSGGAWTRASLTFATW